MKSLFSRRLVQTLLPLFVLLAAAGCTTAKIEAVFAPDADLWPRWQQHDSNSQLVIDHGAWTAFLGKYLETDKTGLNRVNYSSVTPQDKTALDGYVNQMAALPISSYNRDEQYAYWVNLYNAVTVQHILDNYPTASIRDLNDGFLSPGPWDRKLVTVEQQQVTLNDIENRILRPIWDDPRTHYAVNCASIGCPNLQNVAFTGANRQQLLDKGAKEYVNNPRGVRVERGQLVVSSIYAWFEDDFGGSEQTVITHIRQYANRDLLDKLKGKSRISDYEYDWALNDTKTQ